MNWTRQFSGLKRDGRRAKRVTDWNCCFKCCRERWFCCLKTSSAIFLILLWDSGWDIKQRCRCPEVQPVIKEKAASEAQHS